MPFVQAAHLSKRLFVASLAPLLVACSPVAMIDRLTPTDTYAFRGDIAYGPAARQRLDIYRPLAAAGGAPVVVFFYGGSWTSGNRAMYRFVGEALAARGIVTVIADYRLYPEVRYPDFLYDCARAVAWTLRHAAQFGGDPHQLYLMGHSAGAYNAAMLALNPHWLHSVGLQRADLAGWIGLAGPYDFLPITDREVQPVFDHPDYPPGCMPIDSVRDDRVPRTFLGAARADSLVNPLRNTVQLANALRAHGAQVTLELYTGVNHQTLIGSFAAPLRWMSPVLGDVVRFVRAAASVCAAPAGATRLAQP